MSSHLYRPLFFSSRLFFFSAFSFFLLPLVVTVYVFFFSSLLLFAMLTNSVFYSFFFLSFLAGSYSSRRFCFSSHLSPIEIWSFTTKIYMRFFLLLYMPFLSLSLTALLFCFLLMPIYFPSLSFFFLSCVLISCSVIIYVFFFFALVVVVSGILPSHSPALPCFDPVVAPPACSRASFILLFFF